MRQLQGAARALYLVPGLQGGLLDERPGGKRRDSANFHEFIRFKPANYLASTYRLRVGHAIRLHSQMASALEKPARSKWPRTEYCEVFALPRWPRW